MNKNKNKRKWFGWVFGKKDTNLNRGIMEESSVYGEHKETHSNDSSQLSSLESKILMDDGNEFKRELRRLSESFEILKETAETVNKAASNTASFLSEESSSFKHRFFSVIDSIPDIVIIKDTQNRWKTANKTTQNIYGFKSVSDYYMKTNEEIVRDCPHLKFVDNMINSGIDDTFVLEKYKEDKDKDNDVVSFHSIDTMRVFDSETGKTKTKFFDNVRSIIDDGSGKKEMVIIARDVSKIIETNQKNRLFSKALNSASDVIIFIDKHGIISFINETFLRVFGYNDFKEVEGKPISILKSGEHDTKFYDGIWSSVRKNQVWNGTIINRTKDGRNLECAATIIPVMNGEPEPIFSITVLKPVKK